MAGLTGEPDIDLVLEAGPRTFGPYVPKRVREEIAKSPSLHWYRDALKRMAQEEVAQLHRDIEQTSYENRAIESSQEFKACNGLGYPAYRIPLGVWFKFEDLYGKGCWKDEDFVEDVLKHHPGLRVRVTRGTRGQEYAGRGGRSEK